MVESATDINRHPMSENDFLKQGVVGAAGQTSIANVDLTAEYRGVSAHAGGNPWDGINALDAVVSAYNNISMLRQQIRPRRTHSRLYPSSTESHKCYTRIHQDQVFDPKPYNTWSEDACTACPALH